MDDVGDAMEAEIALQKQRRALTNKVTTEDTRICNVRLDLKGGGPDFGV